VDGDFGPLTEEAVKRFQKANQLKATGVIDEDTAAAMNLRLPGAGAPANVLVPNPMGLQPTINYAPGGAGGGVFFGGRGGEEGNDPRAEAIARAREIARMQQKENRQSGEGFFSPRIEEAEALRQQISALQSAIETLQHQHRAAEEQRARAEEQEKPSR
jgi:peptidoglycan hydrolase-like protein with peptidoglycan-binding domain